MQQRRLLAATAAETHTVKVSKPCRYYKTNKVCLGGNLDSRIRVINIHGVIAYKNTGFNPIN